MLYFIQPISIVATRPPPPGPRRKEPMLLIHATVLDSGALSLWVEHGFDDPDPGRSAHPRASNELVTREALRLLLGLPDGNVLSVQSVTLHLPTRWGAPLPAMPEVSARGSQDNDGPTHDFDVATISAWTVAACVLGPPEATLLLAHLDAGRLPVGRFAADLEGWSAVARWTLSLMLAGRLVPALVCAGDAPRRGTTTARCSWIPTLDAERDAADLAGLAEGLPPSGRCHAAEPRAARDLIAAFVTTAVDTLGRHWIARAVLPPLGLADLPEPGPMRAWVDALRRGEDHVAGRGDALVGLADDVSRWQRALQSVGERLDFRTGFSLEAPGVGEADRWIVAIFLEAVGDPALRVSAADVWGGEPHLLERGARRLENPHARLLADLGRAVRVFAPLGRALAEPRPERCALARDEASTFIRSTAWMLEENGFAVALPRWASDTATGPRLLLSAREEGAAAADGDESAGVREGEARFGLQSLLSYEWQVALGGDVMDPREFECLAQSKVPLVQMRDGWAVVEPAPAAATLEVWSSHAGRPLTLADALRLAAGADGRYDTIPPVELTLDGELAALTDIRRVKPVAPPPDLQAALRPYQAQGFSWMADRLARGLGICLADDMGLGKTIQMITLMLHDRGHGPWLLISPTSLVGNWVREMEKFAPSLRVTVHHGRSREADDDGADVVVTTYGLVARDEALHARQWRGVALDEAQSIKNADARQARAVRELHTTHRIAMTGTPVENRLADLWSIMEFIEPGLLGTREVFRRRFSVPIERDGDEGRRACLRKAVSPFLLRRVKTDPTVVPDLPDKIERKVYCPLTREQASLYEATVRERLGRIEESDGIARRGAVLATMLRLKQICNHPAQFLDDDSALAGRSGKLGRLEEMLDGVLAGGERALVFTQFREWAVRLTDHLRARLGVDVACLHGETSREERDHLVMRFQAEDGPPIFVLSVKAGGVGLTLTRATHIFHFDRWWNPAVENQATDRAFRIGQRRDVQVHKFVCQGTLEEAIDRLLESKRGLAESVVGGGEAWLTELTMGELTDMLTLREIAVEDDA